MVAFGHYIEHLKTCKPEWASRFLNYGNLKTLITTARLLSDMERSEIEEVDSDEETPFVCYSEEDLRIYKSYTPVTLEEVRDQFKAAVEHEVDKAGQHHSHLLEQFKTVLDDQMEDFWSGGLGAGMAPHPPEDNPKYWENKRLCENLYQEVSTLKHFSGTHRIAIRKIIKKYNKQMKRAQRPDLTIDTAIYLARYNDQAQDPQGGGYSNILLETIECTYAEFHSCENIQDARRQLKSSIQHHGNDMPVYDVFCMGLLVGILIPFLFCVGILSLNKPEAMSLESFDGVLPAHRALVLLNLAMWGWTLDLYLFNRCYLNHTYILGNNPDTQLQWTEMVRYAAGHTIIITGNLALHLFWYGQLHVHFTLIILFGTMALFLLPLPIFNWSTRKSAIHIACRCAILPFTLPFQLLFNPSSLVTVQFRDFFLADQLISAAIVLSDLSYSACFGLRSAGAAPETYLEVADSCLKWNSNIKPLIICWPYLWRTCQCIVMLKVTNNKVHLANLGKYSIGVLVLGVGFAATHTESLWIDHSWVIVGGVGQVYAWLWDFLMDWGWKLFDFGSLWRKSKWMGKGASGPPRVDSMRTVESATALSEASPAPGTLTSPHVTNGFKTRRRHLSWTVHCVAIPLDLAMRLLFFTTVNEGLSPKVLDPRMLLFFLGAVEIIRRSFWNVLRIENEQLHNLESYRSKTDEVPEPMNEIFGEDWVSAAKKAKRAAPLDDPEHLHCSVSSATKMTDFGTFSTAPQRRNTSAV
eukprot:Rhum_TRINITY_DN18884_c0_g1::Rhum_TRINITY_DN18884_c0_g1_i1::g.168693::m.168693